MSKGNLLIVDDDPVLVKLLKQKLKNYADTIYTAVDGVEALAIILKENVHCVICDVIMPKMNGVELIKTIRSANNSIPFIFYTGQGNHEIMLEVAKYGAFDFFDKPNFSGLEEVIVRGLKEGFHRNTDIASEASILSEYQQMLNDLDKK